MVKKIKWCLAVIALTVSMTALNVKATGETGQPNEIVMSLGEDESVVINLLSTLPPNKALFLNENDNLLAYLFDEDNLYLVYQEEDSAEEWLNESMGTLGSVDSFNYSRMGQQLMNQLAQDYPDINAVVELASITYQLNDVTTHREVISQGEEMTMVYPSKIVQAQNDENEAINLQFRAEDTWQAFTDSNGKEYVISSK